MGIQVLLIVGVTISQLEIGVTIGPEETVDVAMAAVSPADGNGSATESAGAGDAGEATGSDTGTAAGGSVSGAAVYASSCAGCHGASGQGGVGPALAGRSISGGAITAVVGSGRGLMPSFGSTLSSEEIGAVAAYVSGLGTGSDSDTSNGGVTGSDPGTAARASVSGAAVYASSCAGCHGASGQGGVGPALAGRSISGGAVRAVVGSGRGLMPSFGSTLSSEEIGAVAAYVSGLGTGSGTGTAAGGTGSGTGSTTGGTGSGTGSTTGGSTAGSVSGAAVYASNCAGCHGASGQGGVGPALAGRSISSGAITAVVGSGRGLMPSFGSTLSSEEIGAVAAYVSGLGTGSGSEPAPPPPRPSGPAETYAFRCAGCHGADGRGTTLAPYILDRADKVFRTVRRGDEPMPSFPPDVISDAELRALADYIARLDPDGDEDRSGSNSGSG
ncbi:MAG: cytochrome c [Acidimicrobiia bacterium]|nr:cytochrome c [Acidimicrobiia bacterium]